MAKQFTLTSYHNIQGDGISENDVPVGPYIFANSPAERLTVSLSAGDNLMLLPASPAPTAKICEIIPPSGSTNAKTIKGAPGDTGVLMNPAIPVRLSFDPTVTSFFYITSAGSEAVTIVWG